MKKKKSFTLIELLVVISILAILSTVSILGYTSITKKANLSNDISLITQWNKILHSNEYDKENYNIIKVKELFKNNGSNEESFKPQSTNYLYYWNQDDNKVYLVDDLNVEFKIIYPKENKTEIEEQYKTNKNKFYRLDSEYTIADIAISKLPEAITNLTFNNTEQALITSGTVKEGWILKYAVTTIFSSQGITDDSFIEDLPKVINAGKYTVLYKAFGKENNEDSNIYRLEVIISRATQTILAPSEASKTSTSVTLNNIEVGNGATKYGYSDKNDASTVTNWQDDVEFTGLTEQTIYYFFSKYEGNSNYEAVVSNGTIITTSSK